MQSIGREISWRLVPILSFVLFGCQTLPENETQKVNWLKANTRTVESINPADTSFADLEFLRHELDSVDVVSLGESTHGDGSTFLAKTRLIKFLHQKLGFDVIAFESGLVDCHEMDKAFKRGSSPDSAFRKGVFEIWSRSTQLKPFVSYIHEQNIEGKQLSLCGFDYQFSGQITRQERMKALLRLLQKQGISIDTSAYRSFLTQFGSDDKWRLWRLRKDTATQRVFFAELNSFIAYTRDKIEATEEGKVWKQYLINLPPLYRYFLGYNSNGTDAENRTFTNLRDSMMAVNLKWIKEELFPGKKIIIWAANAHIGYNRHKLKRFNLMRPMGGFLKSMYGEKYYSMAFTAFNGKMNHMVQGIQNVPQASNKSLEYFWSKTGKSYAYLSMNEFTSDLFPDTLQARLYGYSDFDAEWRDMTDGVFFIRTMEPSHVIKRTK